VWEQWGCCVIEVVGERPSRRLVNTQQGERLEAGNSPCVCVCVRPLRVHGPRLDDESGLTTRSWLLAAA